MEPQSGTSTGTVLDSRESGRGIRLPEDYCSPVHSVPWSAHQSHLLPQGLCAGWCPAPGPLFRCLESESIAQVCVLLCLQGN